MTFQTCNRYATRLLRCEKLFLVRHLSLLCREQWAVDYCRGGAFFGSHITRTNLLLCDHLKSSLPPRARRTARPRRCASFSVVVSTFHSSPNFAGTFSRRMMRSKGFFSRARPSSLRNKRSTSPRSTSAIPSRWRTPDTERSVIFLHAGQ